MEIKNGSKGKNEILCHFYQQCEMNLCLHIHMFLKFNLLVLSSFHFQLWRFLAIQVGMAANLTDFVLTNCEGEEVKNRIALGEV